MVDHFRLLACLLDTLPSDQGGPILMMVERVRLLWRRYDYLQPFGI